MKPDKDRPLDLPTIPYDAWIADRISGRPAGRTDHAPDQGPISQPVLTRAALEAYQLERLNLTLIHAKAQSRFYARHLADRALPDIPLTSLDQVASLPMLEPWQIREHGQAMLCVGQGQISRIVTLSTSGTTGPAKRLFFTPDDHDLTLEIFRVSMLQVARPGESSYVLLPCSSPGGVGDLLLRAIAKTGARAQAHGLIASLPELAGRLAKEPSCCLVGIPAQVMALARYCQHMALALPVRSVLLCTDHVPDAVCHAIGKIWHCPVHEYYGMTEACYAGGMECAAHAGCHLHEADLLVEIVDPASGQPVPEGEYGEVVITSLLRRGMPLIRYRTGDLSRLIPGQCSCGSVLRRLEKIRARKDCLTTLGSDWTDQAYLDKPLLWIKAKQADPNHSGLVHSNQIYSGMNYFMAHLQQNNKGLFAHAPHLTMAELDETLWPLPWLASFSASLKRDREKDRLCLELGVFGGNSQTDRENMDMQARLALTSIPIIASGLEQGRLDLELEIHEQGDLVEPTAGKRQIRMV